MLVRNLWVHDFRGVKEAQLEECGSLNVLIGRNNSGKSTLLDALSLFFDVLQSQSIVQLDSPLADSRNFRHAADRPIKITVQLALSSVELGEILDLVSAEAQQMKNVLDGLRGSQIDLQISVSASRLAGPHAYIERIAMIQAGETEAQPVLFAMEHQAATEFQRKAREARRAERAGIELERAARGIDPGDFSRLKERSLEGAAGRSYVRQFVNRYATTVGSEENSHYAVETALFESDDFAQFRQRIESLTQASQQEARSLESAALSNPISTFTGNVYAVPQYALAILTKISATTALHLRDRREPVGREEARRLLALKVRRGGPEVLRGIQETVQSLMGVAIDAFESTSPSRRDYGRNETPAEMDVDEVLVEMNGAGIREALRLVLDSELSNPNVLLVEEPEVHLHPALEMSMLRYLQAVSQRTQVFVTTHSTNFLDSSDMRNVYLVTRDESVRARQLDFAAAEEALPGELGLRLSSLFMYDRLVFVEGPSDEAVLRELAATLDLNLGRAGVGFVPMGGSRNFTHYATQATISLMTKRRVAMTFIIDRDEATDDEIAKLRRLVGDAATLEVLDRRELENYLIAPRALTNFIEMKQSSTSSGGQVPAVESVQQTLAEVADQLRSEIVQRRVTRAFSKPLYPSQERIRGQEAGSVQNLRDRIEAEVQTLREELDGRAAAVAALAETEEKIVQDQWAANRFSLAPGDELIDLTCQAYGVRFRKERDAARLASLLTRDEVPQPLAAILRRIASN